MCPSGCKLCVLSLAHSLLVFPCCSGGLRAGCCTLLSLTKLVLTQYIGEDTHQGYPRNLTGGESVMGTLYMEPQIGTVGSHGHFFPVRVTNLARYNGVERLPKATDVCGSRTLRGGGCHTNPSD